MSVKIQRLWEDLVFVARAADWPMILGVFFLVAITLLAVAIVIRHTSRERRFSPDLANEHFTARHLPVVYLSKADGKLKEMTLTHSQFMTFGDINNKILQKKHPMCTDESSWSHFCLLAAAEAYLRISTGKGEFNVADDQDTVNNVIESTIEDLAEPYVEHIFKRNTNVLGAKVKGALTASTLAARTGSGTTTETIHKLNANAVSIDNV